MNPLLPFIVSGGANTERYYFKHLSEISIYKFNLIPEYFGEESNYTSRFPSIIDKIRKANPDALIFCVFDMDNVVTDAKCISKHNVFLKKMDGKAIICPSMPSIEYWFLLHFSDDKRLLKKWGEISRILAPYIRPCFLNPTGQNLKDLLKKEKNVSDKTWVERLCADNKLDLAIRRAEENIVSAIQSNTLYNQSYTFVYRVFTLYQLYMNGDWKQQKVSCYTNERCPEVPNICAKKRTSTKKTLLNGHNLAKGESRENTASFAETKQ